jgi:hypothetical protein
MKTTPSTEKEYTTKDEFDADDWAFFEAHKVLMGGAGDLEKAAAIVTDYALTSGDRLALAFFLARFADFVEAGKLPPTPMRKGFRGAIEALKTKDNGKGKGRSKMSLVDREWARTHAMLVADFLRDGASLEDAVNKVVAFRAARIRRETGHPDLSAPRASIAKIKRDYLKFRRLKK